MKLPNKNLLLAFSSALVGGVFALGAVIPDYPNPSVVIGQPYEEITRESFDVIEGEEKEKLLKQVLKLTNINEPEIFDVEIMAFDFLGDHRKKEILFAFRTHGGAFFRYGIISSRHLGYELIFNDDNDMIADDLQCLPIRVGNAVYLLIGYINGKIRVMAIQILKYDAGKTPAVIWESPSAYNYGNVDIRDGALSLKGGMARYIIYSSNNKFEMKRDTTRYKTNTTGVNRLWLESIGDQLRFYYNDKYLTYNPSEYDAYFEESVSCHAGEIIVIDDNIAAGDGDRFLRISGESQVKINYGYFYQVSPEEPGEKELIFRDTYGPWYHLKINVTQ